MSLPHDARHVVALVVARCSAPGADGAATPPPRILASHVHWDRGESRENYEEVLKKVFVSPGWAAVVASDKRKLELKAGAQTYCLELDGDRRVFAAVITSGYPVRLVFSSGVGGPKLLGELRSHVTSKLGGESMLVGEKGLQRALKPFLSTLASKFDDLDGIDKLTATSAKADAAKAALYNTLKVAGERGRLLDNNLASSEGVLDSAKRMFGTANTLKSAQRRLYRRRCCLVVSCITVVVGIAVVVILDQTVYHWTG